MAITDELHKVLILVPDPDTVLLDFDRISVYKSTTGSSGDYQEILKETAAAATLVGAKKEGFSNLDGTDFKFEANGVEKTASFTTEYTAAEVAARIIADTGVTAADDSGYVRLTSSGTGFSSTLKIHESSEGGVELGFYSGDYDIGEELWIVVASGTKLYILDDEHGDNDYWYKYEFVNSSTYVRSEESAPFQAQPLGALDPSNIVYGVGYIADTEGNPVAGKTLVLYNRFVPTIVGGMLIDGPETVHYQTDDIGLISIPLVKGSKISIGIEDTKLRRDIDVPTGATAESFDLFSASLLDDRLGIVYYPIVDAERTTL
jgi:hypothetical protein